MNVSSFNKNVVVLGHYFTPCPPAGGATPQANNAPAKNNFVAKLASQITDFLHKNLAWIFGKESLASFGGYYCPVKGTISGKQGAGETNLIFTPSQVLDPGIDYYVIIQGVNNLSDNTTGVLSFWGIGMNASNSPVPNSTYFIDRAYPNSYIWSFTTKASNGEDNGICAIDHVKIIPDSYLINVATSDLNENDTDPSSKTFDTANDNDKAFYASALSVDNQVLHPVSGYSWNWNWENSSPAVAVFINNNSQPFGINDSSQLVRAVGGVVDDNTKIKAIVNLTEQSVTNAGNNASSTADVYVFICTTPWPDKIVGAAWYPWRDQTEGANCLSGSGNCQNMNYALYYCRDTGDAAKTLPTVAMPVTTRGTNLGCTDTGAPADSCNGKLAGASCGANGGTCQDLLKESYFFSK
jgi:hypothetical protein